MFILGFFIHLVLLFSIFDIYFKSPIVKNAKVYEPDYEAPADRLVLIVIDGLRAKSFVNYTTMSYLRSVANTKGRWGISRTRVPTKSRPGFIAITAGFYEDPSAIAKGWRENPVDFDSVFNQSAYTWCWGTYDILDIFTRGAVNDNIFVDKYDSYDQGFSSNKNTTLLDEWVFSRVKKFFDSTKYDDELKIKLQRKKIIFFLHLPGTDHAGHTYKPDTKIFLTTIKFVDEQIKEIERHIREFYNDDNRTTFLMTSDHGMTDWGSHGTGDDDETFTPYVLWGAGVQQVKNKTRQYDLGTNLMSSDNRYDINQADLAPLMSTMLSMPVPINSVGQLPSALLEMSLPNKAKAVYSNCRQMISQYNKKRLDVEANAIPMLYQPFEKFDGKKVQEIISFTEKLLQTEQYEKVITISDEIISLSLSGLIYYHNYYQRPLLITVTLSFLGWIMYSLRFLMKQKMLIRTEFSENKNYTLTIRSKIIDMLIKITSVCIAMILGLIIYVQKLPIQYYIYFFLPIFLWYSALIPSILWIQTLNLLTSKRKIYLYSMEILCYTLGSISLGLALTHRWVLSIPLLGMSVWPFFSSSIHNLPTSMCIAWPIGCVLLSIFSFMSVIGKRTCILLVLLAGALWMVIIGLYTSYVLLPHYNDNKVAKREVILNVLQLIVFAVSLQIIYFQSKWFDGNVPTSLTLQAVCWIISVVLPFFPLLHSKKFVNRLLGINTSVLNFYLLLSVAHEGLFMVALIFNVNCWMAIEFKFLKTTTTTKENPRFFQLHKLYGSLILATELALRNPMKFFAKRTIPQTYSTQIARKMWNPACILVFYVLVKMFAECEFETDMDVKKEENLTCIDRSVNSDDFRRAFFFILYIILAYFGTGNIASLNSFEVRWVICFTTSYLPFIIAVLILLKTLSPFLSVACTFKAVQHITKAPLGCLHTIVLIYSNIMGLLMLYHVKNTGSWIDIGNSISQYVIVQVITLFIVLINQIAKMLTEIEIQNALIKLFKNKRKQNGLVNK